MDPEKENVQEASNVEAASQPDTALSQAITQEHRDYLMKRHGTAELHPVPSMDPQVKS